MLDTPIMISRWVWTCQTLAIFIKSKMATIAICAFISRKIIYLDLMLVSSHNMFWHIRFLIPMNHLELFIYFYMVLYLLKIQYGCQICELFFFVSIFSSRLGILIIWGCYNKDHNDHNNYTNYIEYWYKLAIIFNTIHIIPSLNATLWMYQNKAHLKY